MTAPQWTGTPAEWDAERDRLEDAMQTAMFDAFQSAGKISNSEWIQRAVLAVLPPRPVEPPSVVTGLGWSVGWDGTFFFVRQLPKEHHALHDRRAHTVAAYVGATDDEFAKIVELRDGPTARYEVCGYEHWRGNKYVQTFHVNANRDAEGCKQSVQFEAIQSVLGGTAHAIYKRVGGEK